MTDLPSPPEPAAVPAYVAAAPTTRPRRTAAAAAVAVLAVAAGAFGVMTLAAGDGSESPEAAVEAMFAAIDQEDVIGVLEALDPVERDILRPAVEETGEQAERVEVASNDLDLRKVAGVDLEVEGLTFTTERLGDGITAVDLTGGTVSSSADLDRMPVGATVKTLLDRDEDQGGDGDRSASDTIELAGTRLVATEADGGWHVSVLYSIAESVRLDGDPVAEVPDFGAGIAARGAADPEAAVRAAIDAANHGDVRRLIELSPPGEMAVLHDYGPILVNEAGDPNEEPWADVAALELETADGPDGTKVVSATSFEAVAAEEYSTTTWNYDGSCTTLTQQYDESFDDGWTNVAPNEGVLVEAPDPEVPGSETHTSEYCDDDPRSGVFSPFLFWSGGTAGQLRFVTQEHDGEWFVSPSRSIIESTIGGVRDLGVDDVRLLARLWAGESWLAEPDELWEACGVDRPADDVTAEAGEAALVACYDALPEDYAGGYGYGYGFGFGFGYGGSSEVYEAEGEAIDERSYPCYEGDAAATEACLADLVEQGVIAPSELEAYRCDAAYNAVIEAAGDLEDVDEATWDAADRAYGACMAEVFDEGGTDAGGGEAAPTPTTPVPTATTVPPPAPAPSTTSPPFQEAPEGRVPDATTTTTLPGS